jgi:hypothetical protein
MSKPSHVLKLLVGKRGHFSAINLVLLNAKTRVYDLKLS